MVYLKEYKIQFFKDLLFNFLIYFVTLNLIFFINEKNAFAIDSLIENNIGICTNTNNCVLENWEVTNVNESFKELIDILNNTPRIKIIDMQKDYLHALATSRVMKYVDDIEIEKLEKENILKVKSKSRIGFYDLGVNKRRINTLHFRLIDIYK